MNPRPFTIENDRLVSEAAQRIMQRCEVLAGFSESSTNLTRTFCCPQMHCVHEAASQWMAAAGMTSHIDAVSNIVGRQVHGNDDRVFMIGSHLDTIANAGKYDGVLGFLLGIAIAELFHESKIELTFSLDVVGFSEEEGVRFKRPYIGSAAVAGQFDPSILKIADAQGISMRETLKAFGQDPAEFDSASYVDRGLVGFIEAHIEQGPVLENEDCSVGVVSAIAGQTRATFTFEGTSGHAGTVPLNLRCDALACAAEFISEVERCAAATEGMFATVGEMDIFPNVSNVIAGQTKLRLDLRHENDPVRETAFTKLQKFACEIADRRGLICNIEVNLDQVAVRMDQQISIAIEDSIRKMGFEPRIMPSGAGHDAVMMAQLTPTGMLFIRCRGGISHHPDEHVELDDVTTALKIMSNTLIQLSHNF